MEPTTDPSAWLRIGEFLSAQFGPGGFVLSVVCAAQAYALYKCVIYFGNRDDQKRGDVLNIVTNTTAALEKVKEAVNRLQIVIAAQTGRTDV